MNILNKTLAIALTAAFGLATASPAQLRDPNPRPTPALAMAANTDGTMQLTAHGLGGVAHIAILAWPELSTVTLPPSVGLKLLYPHVILADFDARGVTALSTASFRREDIAFVELYVQVVGITDDARLVASPITAIKGAPPVQSDCFHR